MSVYVLAYIDILNTIKDMSNPHIPNQYTTLKKLQVTNIPELVENLNYNFEQLLDGVVFKGIQGKPGQPGNVGSQGKRGAAFMYLKDDKFLPEFEPALDADAITLAHINNAIATNSTYLFAECTNFQDIVHNDYLILPNGQTVCYNSVTGLFEETYVRFLKNVDLLTEQRVIELIRLNSISSNGLMNIYESSNKQVPDDNPNAGTINPVFDNVKSLADIAVGPSAGFKTAALQFVALQETAGFYNGRQSQLNFISGHVANYHKLLQNTIAANLNKHAPVITNSPVQTIIQNTLHAGITLGSIQSNTLDNFAHIRRTNNALELMHKYSNDANIIAGYPKLSISETLSLINVNMSLQVEAQIAKLISTGNGLGVKVSANSIDLDNPTVLFTKLKSSLNKVLCIDTNGKVYVNNLRVAGALNTSGDAFASEAVIAAYVTNHVNARLGWVDARTVITRIDEQIAAIPDATVPVRGLIKLADRVDPSHPGYSTSAVTPKLFNETRGNVSRYGTMKRVDYEAALQSALDGRPNDDAENSFISLADAVQLFKKMAPSKAKTGNIVPLMNVRLLVRRAKHYVNTAGAVHERVQDVIVQSIAATELISNNALNLQYIRGEFSASYAVGETNSWTGQNTTYANNTGIYVTFKMPANNTFTVLTDVMFSVFVNVKVTQWNDMTHTNDERWLTASNASQYGSQELTVHVPFAYVNRSAYEQYYDVNVAIYSNSYKMVKHWPIYAGLDLGD